MSENKVERLCATMLLTYKEMLGELQENKIIDKFDEGYYKGGINILETLVFHAFNNFSASERMSMDENKYLIKLSHSSEQTKTEKS